MAVKTNFDTLVTVFGGSGFLGRHVVRALANRNYLIRVAVRRPELAGHLQPLGRVGQIHAVQANVRFAQSIEAAVRDADIVINLVGILFETGPPALRCRAGGRRGNCGPGRARRGRAARSTSRLSAPTRIQVSDYARSKAAGERLVLAAQPRSDYHAAVDHFRSRRRLLQPFRRTRPHRTGAAASRWRPYPLSAGVCRRCGRCDRQSRRR